MSVENAGSFQRFVHVKIVFYGQFRYFIILSPTQMQLHPPFRFQRVMLLAIHWLRSSRPSRYFELPASGGQSNMM
jgi:hypothetical protein